jgi:hypothetical protein
MILSLVASLGLLAQADSSHASGVGQPAMKCTVGTTGLACSAQQVRRLASMATEPNPNSPLAKVKTISLAAHDGTLSCVQASAQKCNAAQAQELQRLGAALNLMVSIPAGK